MLDTAPDRRRRRSADPLVALHHQLAQAREEGSHDAVVLAEASGLVVAGAGAWPVCEELAAFAPLLARELAGEIPSARVRSLRREASVLAFEVDGQEMFLCARGGEGREGSVARAAQGVSRILRDVA